MLARQIPGLEIIAGTAIPPNVPGHGSQHVPRSCSPILVRKDYADRKDGIRLHSKPIR